MADKELVEALKHLAYMTDRAGKASWLNFQATQKMMESRTPTSIHFGSYNFNPTASATQLAAWQQVVPRNPRRKKIIFSALNQTLFLATSDNSLPIANLIVDQANGWNGSIPVMEFTFAAGVTLPLETTEAIYFASLTGAGSLIEQTAIVSWSEEIYSSVSAIPLLEDNPQRPSEVGGLTAGEMSSDALNFGREGVR